MLEIVQSEFTERSSHPFQSAFGYEELACGSQCLELLTRAILLCTLCWASYQTSRLWPQLASCSYRTWGSQMMPVHWCSRALRSHCIGLLVLSCRRRKKKSCYQRELMSCMLNSHKKTAGLSRIHSPANVKGWKIHQELYLTTIFLCVYTLLWLMKFNIWTQLNF